MAVSLKTCEKFVYNYFFRALLGDFREPTIGMPIF